MASLPYPRSLVSFPQISQIYTDSGMRLFSHGCHRSAQMLGCVVIPRNALLLWEDAVTVWLVQWSPLHPLGGCVGMAGMPYPPMQISTPQHLTTTTP